MVDLLGLVASVVYVDVDVDIFLHRMVKLAAGRATRAHVISFILSTARWAGLCTSIGRCLIGDIDFFLHSIAIPTVCGRYTISTLRNTTDELIESPTHCLH